MKAARGACSVLVAGNMQSSVSFTLPISCQICLGKVKEPVTCSNQHVFCSSCMNVWLDRNNICPTCRVEITSQSPLRKIIGGVLESREETDKSRETSRELKRARFELVLKEYEDEILRCENEVDNLQKQNIALRKHLEASGNAAGPSSSNLKPAGSCSRCCNITDWDELLDLSKKLQEATNTYAGMKEELAVTKKENGELLKCNDDLIRENKRIKEEFIARSPMKYGRLTVATLESRLEAAQREIEQLKRAMELSDSYIASLEKDLKMYRGEQPVTETSGPEVIQTESLTQFASIVNPPLSDQHSLSQGFEGGGDFLEESKPSFSSLDGGCSIAYDETSKASSFFEMQGFEDSFTNFTPPPIPTNLPPPTNFPTSTPPIEPDQRCSSRKLKFDQPDGGIPSSYSFLPVDSQSSVEEESQLFMHNRSVSVPKPSPSPLLHEGDEKGPWMQSSQSGTKTVINAGGSRITMSQLSADDHERFARPSSAPSRTFLLSGSRFSALRPLDPQGGDSDFQPVKCISPMHLNPGSCADEEKRSTSPKLRLVAPNDVIDSKYRQCEAHKPEDESRGKEVLSRVNILKRKTSAKSPPVFSSVASSPVSEGRRKQKLQHKRLVEVSFQSPQKSQRLRPK